MNHEQIQQTTIFATKNVCRCPNVYVNTISRENAEVTLNVASWGACSELCRQRQGCTAWTWHHENAGQWALQCVTMTGYGYTAHDTNVVSGGRDCETGTFQLCTSRHQIYMDVYLEVENYIFGQSLVSDLYVAI